MDERLWGTVYDDFRNQGLGDLEKAERRNLDIGDPFDWDEGEKEMLNDLLLKQAIQKETGLEIKQVWSVKKNPAHGVNQWIAVCITSAQILWVVIDCDTTWHTLYSVHNYNHGKQQATITYTQIFVAGAVDIRNPTTLGRQAGAMVRKIKKFYNMN